MDRIADDDELWRYLADGIEHSHLSRQRKDEMIAAIDGMFNGWEAEDENEDAHPRRVLADRPMR